MLWPLASAPLSLKANLYSTVAAAAAALDVPGSPAIEGEAGSWKRCLIQVDQRLQAVGVHRG